MGRSHPVPGDRLLRLWLRLRPFPGGRRLFSRAVGWIAPYSGSIRPRVRELEPGRCVVEMADRRRVRNHLDSIHAGALLNLGELASGLATLTALPPDARGIVVSLRADYVKKARGRMRAECRTVVAPVPEPRDHRARAEIRDRAGDRVATVEATWRLAPREAASPGGRATG